jgi:hypothetical protein
VEITALFKSLVWSNLVEFSIKKLFLAVPWLGWGPIGWITSTIIRMFAEALFEAVHEQIDLQIITFRKISLRREFDRAALLLKIMERDHGKDSSEFKEQYENTHEDFANFVEFRV